MPLLTEIAPWNFYRLGPAKEKELFKRQRDAYSGVVIPAHIASYYQKFCLEFVGSLQKPYFIDPVTHLFVAEPRSRRRFVKDKTTNRTVRNAFGEKTKGNIKRSYQKLTDAYGGIIEEIVIADRRIELTDFSNDLKVREFVERVCQFQLDALSALPQKYKKYEKYAAKAIPGAVGQPNHPMCLIPPYFPITDEKWLALNVRLACIAKEFSRGIPIVPVILGTVDTLASSAMRIRLEYESCAPSGFLLWPDGFSGNDGISQLGHYRSIVKTLSGSDSMPVIGLYGDALSLVMHFHGMTGFACGICYGEKREADQDMDVEGMIPPRYYIAMLKKKYQLETDLRREDLSKHPRLRCDCSICQSASNLCDLNDDQTREHFMLARLGELRMLRNGQRQEEMKSYLEKTYLEYKNVFPFSPVTHLNNWASIL